MPGVMGAKVEVRYEPYNARQGYALVGKVWHDAFGRDPELEGRTDKEIKVLSVQLRRRLNRMPTPREMAEYIYALKQREQVRVVEQAEHRKRIAQFAVLDGKEQTAQQEHADTQDVQQHADHDDQQHDAHDDQQRDEQAEPQDDAHEPAAVTAASSGEAATYELPSDDEIAEMLAQYEATEEAA
jgi:hypothetical protein